MLYDESYEVRDGDIVQTPKHGSASAAVHNRISIKSTPAVVFKQKSATEVTTQQHQLQQSSSAAPDGKKKQNIKSEYLKRPATCLNGNNNNSRQYYENLTGLTRTLETSRATYRVGSSSVGMSAAASERPASRNASGKTRPITPEDPETPGTEDDDDEEDDDEEYDNIHRENEETFQHIESVAKRELKGMKEYCSNDSEDEDDDSDSSVHAVDAVGCTHSHRRLVSGSPSCGFPLKTRTALGGQNNICVSSAALAAAAASNLIPEDLFDVMNVSDGLVAAAIGEEDEEEEDNEEERLRRYFTRQHFHEIQLDNKREEIRRKVLAQACETNSLAGVGIHRHGHWVYNPADYENLRVSPEIKEVFQFITKYVPSPASCQVDVKLKPFIPEYYPSVGDIDAFIKVVHPEVKDDSLGIKHLDEPSAFQSDPSVLDLRLRALAKQNSAKAIVVKKVENVGKNAKIIDNWINDISDLHRSKPSPSVHYSKPMPDIDHLIQEWPPEIEDLLKNVSLPPPDLDCDLATYVDIVCNLLDIPVYKSRIQSLHVLCTLYMNYKSFNQYGGGAGGDGNILTSSAVKHGGDSGGNVDRLEL